MWTIFVIALETGWHGAWDEWAASVPFIFRWTSWVVRIQHTLCIKWQVNSGVSNTNSRLQHQEIVSGVQTRGLAGENLSVNRDQKFMVIKEVQRAEQGHDKIKAIIKASKGPHGAVWWLKCWQCTCQSDRLSQGKCRLTCLPLCTWQPGLSILSSCPHKQPIWLPPNRLVSRTVFVTAVWPQWCGANLRAGMRISIQIPTLVSQSLPRGWTLEGYWGQCLPLLPPA